VGSLLEKAATIMEAEKKEREGKKKKKTYRKSKNSP
jgi:hypothetical protein